MHSFFNFSNFNKVIINEIKTQDVMSTKIGLGFLDESIKSVTNNTDQKTVNGDKITINEIKTQDVTSINLGVGFLDGFSKTAVEIKDPKNTGIIDNRIICNVYYNEISLFISTDYNFNLIYNLVSELESYKPNAVFYSVKFYDNFNKRVNHIVYSANNFTSEASVNNYFKDILKNTCDLNSGKRPFITITLWLKERFVFDFNLFEKKYPTVNFNNRVSVYYPIDSNNMISLQEIISNKSNLNANFISNSTEFIIADKLIRYITISKFLVKAKK